MSGQRARFQEGARSSVQRCHLISIMRDQARHLIAFHVVLDQGDGPAPPEPSLFDQFVIRRRRFRAERGLAFDAASAVGMQGMAKLMDVGRKQSMDITLQEKMNQANELFFLRATLTQPVALDGRLDSFREESKRALSSTRPPSARNWSVQLETPARCVIRTILSAPSEQEAAQQVLRVAKVAFGAVQIQPGHVAVRARASTLRAATCHFQTVSPAYHPRSRLSRRSAQVRGYAGVLKAGT